MTSAKKDKSGEIRSLTGIRGIAAVYVMLYHGLHHIVPVTSPVFNLVNHGYISVDLFFMLSGFVLCMVYESNFAQVNGIVARYSDFIIKRFARIYPLYFCVTVLAAVLFFIANRKLDAEAWKTLVSNFLLIENWGIARSLAGPTWSLSVEWGGYFLFPFIALAMSKANRAGQLLGVAICVAMVMCAAYFPRQDRQYGVSGPLDLIGYNNLFTWLRFAGEFGLGISAFKIKDLGIVKALTAVPFFDVFMALAIVVLLNIAGSDVFVVFAFFALILSLYMKQASGTAAVLGSAVVFFLGNVSYSIYLIHPFIIGRAPALAAKLGGHLGSPAIAMGVSLTLLALLVIGLAWLSFQFIEVRGRLLISRLARVGKPHTLS